MSLITDIQKYSIHDGDGIRTTVFFKGCHLKCTWCHNPETQSYTKELLFDEEKCIGCGNCVPVCPTGAITLKDGKAVTDRTKCTACGDCIDACYLNLREIAGKEYSVDELVKLLRKDEMFYEESGGGVTLSGGEVMTVDIDYLEALVKKLLDPASSQPKAVKKPKKLPLEMREAQDELSNILATKVQLTGNRQKGRISISYYSAEQLNELYETLRKI